MATVPARAPLSRVTERRVYLAAGIVAALVVTVGFSRTYFLKEYFGTPALTPLVHLQGILFSSWIALFITQAWLVSARRTRVHMRLGIAGFLLACAMIVVGLATAITAARLGHAPVGAPPPLVFLVVPFFDMVVFATLIAAGFSFRRRPDYHKRIMVIATLGILTAAFGRITILLFGSGQVLLAMGATDLLIVTAVAWDTISHRRLHPAFAWAGALVVLSQPLRLAIAHTAAWMSFAQWLTR